VEAVAYLGLGGDSAFDPAGTCFFVCIGPHNYLVTADHVARVVGDGGFDVRLTRNTDGLAQCQRIDYAKWIRHPTQADKVDLAVLEFEFPDWVRTGIISERSFLTDFKRGTKAIGPGDLAYLVGLFQPLYGKHKNMPAVHTGHISLIQDDELLPVQNWLKPSGPPIEVEAYLVQVQNPLPGVSGAPVFVRRSIKRRLHDKDIDPNPAGIEIWNHGSLWLLGVWTDAWYENLKLQAPKGGEVTIPTGMGAVVPVRKLIETLNQPALQAGREARKQQQDRSCMPQKTGSNAVAKVREETLSTMLATPPRKRTQSAKRRVSSK
jgi:hypothetical protein